MKVLLLLFCLNLKTSLCVKRPSHGLGDVELEPAGSFCNIKELENAEIDSDLPERTDYFPGENIDVRCLPGFHFGQKTSFHLICMDGGSWDMQIPKCEAVTCEEPKAIENGQLTVDKRKSLEPVFAFADQISYKCFQGYVLVGSEFQWCESTGWSGTAPKCEAIACRGFPKIENGHIVVKKEVYLPDEEIEVTCYMGYQPTGNSKAYITCNEHGEWNTEHGACTAITCESPEKLDNGFYVLKGSNTFEEKEAYDFLDQLVFDCEPGYTLVGKRLQTCRDGGWSDQVPTCDQIVCQKPPIPQNGWMITSDRNKGIFKYNEVVSFECSRLYSLIGSTERKCTERGWSGSPPECLLRGCPPPESPGMAGSYFWWKKTLYETLDKIPFIPFKEKLGIRCPKGFKRDRFWDAECLSTGRWTKFPECVAIECNQPHSIANGQIDGVHQYQGKKYSFDHQLYYFCKPGYRLFGAASRKCALHGWSPPQKPECKAITCMQPFAIRNGFIKGLYGVRNWTYEYPLYHEISYHCDIGYRLVGEEKRKCNENGWSPSEEPICEVVECPSPDYLENGYIEGIYYERGGKYIFGHELSYHCARGYSLLGEEKRVCTESGWHSEYPPTCEVGACQKPHAITNGQISGLYKGADWNYAYPVNHKIYYSCNTGYRLIGQQSKTCEPSGWSPSFNPICEVISCPDPKIFDGFYRVLSYPSYLATYPNGKIIISCSDGFELIGNQVVECMEDGKWNDTLSKCQAVKRGCDPPEPLINGTFQVFNQKFDYYPVGSRVTYKCLLGYLLIGQPEIICTDDGWSPTSPSCHALCEPPPEIASGILIKKDYYLSGSEAVYKCFAGFKLQPPDGSLMCTEDGWNGPQVSCEVAECIEPGQVNNSVFTSSTQPNVNGEIVSYPQGTSLRYICNKPYRLNGDSLLYCLPSGQWSAGPPDCESAYCTKPDVKHAIPVSGHFRYEPGEVYPIQCLPRYNNSHSGRLTCLPTGAWEPHNVICEEIICARPPPVMSGEFLPSKPFYKFGDTVTYRCPGSMVRLEGIRERKCSENGWDGNSPVCEAKESVKCLCPGALQIGHIVSLNRAYGSNYEVGESVPVECSDGYEPVGNPKDIKIVCTPHGNWSTEMVRCMEKNVGSCPEPPAIQNGRLWGIKVVYLYGDSLTIVCKPGRRPVKRTEIFLCLANATWDGEFSDCEDILCTAPKSPVNGSVEYFEYGPNDMWPFYSEATFICAPGYQLVGHHWIKCLEDGWSSQIPFCKGLIFYMKISVYNIFSS